MRTCNKCNKCKTDKKFRHENKKTCKKCEFRFRQWLLRKLTYVNKLTSYQKIASRIGYMGSAFLICAQWSIEPAFYIIGLIAWITHLLTN